MTAATANKAIAVSTGMAGRRRLGPGGAALLLLSLPVLPSLQFYVEDPLASDPDRPMTDAP